MTPPTPKECTIKCDVFTCICADGSEAPDPPTPKEGEYITRSRQHLVAAVGIGHPDEEGYIDFLTGILREHDALKAERDAAETLVSAQHDALVAMKAERDAWEHRAEVAERENGEALAMLACTGETSLWQAAAATRAKLAEAERERGDADDALAACQAQAAGTIAQLAALDTARTAATAQGDTV